MHWDFHIHYQLAIKSLILALLAYLVITATGFVWIVNGVAVFPPDRWAPIQIIQQLASQIMDIAGMFSLIPIIIIGIFMLMMFAQKIIIAIIMSVIIGIIISPALLGFVLDIILYYYVIHAVMHLFERKH